MTDINHETDREDDAAPTGTDLLNAFAERYKGSGMPLPPVPEIMAGDLRMLGDAAATTRSDDVPGPYGIRWFINEAVANRAPDYCLFGEDGHGLNSRGFQWYLVAGPVAIFVQIAWGGVPQADNAAASELEEQFGSARRLISHIAESVRADRVPRDQRIIVIESFTMGSAWTRHRRGDVPAWHSSPDPFESARNSL